MQPIKTLTTAFTCCILLSTAFAYAQTTDPLDPNFPYNASPEGTVKLWHSDFATPETMLGSWAMQQAVDLDKDLLPAFMSSENTVYAVGTAEVETLLGIPSSGTCQDWYCPDLDGYCFAAKFYTDSDKKESKLPYMIFQSVNTSATQGTFDIYMAGGGSGAYPAECGQFWGTDQSGCKDQDGNDIKCVDWSKHIQDLVKNKDIGPLKACDTYFNNYANFNTNYSVVDPYTKDTHNSLDTLKEACTFASNTGFNAENFQYVNIIPVTCPTALTQVTGLRNNDNDDNDDNDHPATTSLGNYTIQKLKDLTEEMFDEDSKNSIAITTTQMQDCRTPTSGYDDKNHNAVDPYNASISACCSLPMMSGTEDDATNGTLCHDGDTTYSSDYQHPQCESKTKSPDKNYKLRKALD